MPSTTTITAFTIFAERTLIRSSQVNTNFGNFRGHLIPINTDTATASDATHDLGAASHRWLNNYSEVLVMTGQSTPALNPTAGAFKVYMKSDGNLYRINSAGTETLAVSAAAATLPPTTKGDIIVHDGSASVRHPVGANGLVLTADSSATAGLKWATVTAKAFQTWETKTVGTTYLATTDGYVVFYARGVTNTSLVLRWDGITQDTTVPTTVRTSCHLNGHANANYANGAATGLTLPVKLGEYYLVNATQVVGSLTAATVTMSWIPQS